MHFRHHKMLLIILIMLELFLAINVAIERNQTNLVMGIVYFGVVFWFVFGERQWWPYLCGGAAYIAYIVIYKMLYVFELAYDRETYHLVLALLWGGVLVVHLFVERNLGPPTTPPVKPHNTNLSDEE